MLKKTGVDSKTYRDSQLAKLAGGLAHEIKNPLSTMSITLQLLKEDLQGSKNQRNKRCLKRIDILLAEAGRLEGVLGDFLSFARGFGLNPVPTNIVNVVDELLDFIIPELAQKNINVLKHYQENLPLVSIDSRRFKQSLLNLLLNAEQAMPNGGQIILKISKKEDMLQVEVIDTGAGMQPGVVEHIFDVYYSTKKEGSGLGLSTTRRIIEEHGGHIEVESSTGRGSRFSIFLPTFTGKEKE